MPEPPEGHKNPPKAPVDGPKNGPASKKDEPCCCDHLTVYLNEVKVVTRTDAPIPLIGPIAGFFVDDRISVVCHTECETPPVVNVWPHDQPGQKVPEGQSVPVNAPLATIRPSSDCRVSCHVRMDVYRASRVTEVLEALNKLLPELAAAAAAYAQGKLAHLVATDLAALGDKVKELSKAVNELEKALLGADDSLMAEFYFNFEGDLRCESKLSDAIENTLGVKDNSNDDVTIARDIKNFGGEWLLTFKVIRSCPKKAK